MNRPRNICPICAAVVTAWIGLLAVRLFGARVPSEAVATLMGGSAAGGMHLLGERFRAGIPTKAAFLVAGFAAAFFAARETWGAAALAVVAAAAAAAAAIVRSMRHRPTSRSVETLEEKMKQCC